MQSCKQSAKDVKMPGLTEVVCQHKSNAVQSGFGLCRKCYMEFCGGLDGSEPPAFQRAELERLAKESEQIIWAHQKTNDIENIQPKENLKLTEVQCTPSTPEKLDKVSDPVDTSECLEDVPDTVDETNTLSDIDDSENNKRKRALEAKNAKPAQTAAEAAGHLFTKKKLSSKINYDVLNDLFEDDPSPKKKRSDDGDAKGKESGKKHNETNDVGEEEEGLV